MPRVLVPITEISQPKAALTTSCTGTQNDLVFTAKAGGPGGNSIRVAYIVAGNNTPLTIVVEGYDITVNVATGGGGAATSTSALIKAALEASVDTAALISVAHAAANDGTGIVAAFAMTALAGGALGAVPATATDGDATNDNYFTGNDGNVELTVISSDAGSQTVTFKLAPSLSPGVAAATAVETIAAGATRVLGPFAPRLYNQNAAKDVYFDPSVSTTLKFRATRTVKAT